jgi:hypothetical protein
VENSTKGASAESSGGMSSTFLELYLIMAEIDERFLNVNRYGVLSVPGPLWLAMAFLGRHWLLLIVALASRRSPEAVQMAGNSLSWVVLLLEFPVMLLAYAAFSRHPDTGGLIRFIWSKGRFILGMTATLNLVLLGWFLWNSEVWRRWPELFLASCGLLDVVIIYGIYTSGYIKQIFLEFPQPVSVKGKSS